MNGSPFLNVVRMKLNVLELIFLLGGVMDSKPSIIIETAFVHSSEIIRP